MSEVNKDEVTLVEAASFGMQIGSFCLRRKVSGRRKWGVVVEIAIIPNARYGNINATISFSHGKVLDIYQAPLTTTRF